MTFRRMNSGIASIILAIATIPIYLLTGLSQTTGGTDILVIASALNVFYIMLYSYVMWSFYIYLDQVLVINNVRNHFVFIILLNCLMTLLSLIGLKLSLKIFLDISIINVVTLIGTLIILFSLGIIFILLSRIIRKHSTGQPLYINTISYTLFLYGIFHFIYSDITIIIATLTYIHLSILFFKSEGSVSLLDAKEIPNKHHNVDTSQ